MRRIRKAAVRLCALLLFACMCLSSTGCEYWNMPIGEFAELVQQEADEVFTSIGESAEDVITEIYTDTVTLDEHGTAVLVDNSDIYIRLDKLEIESIGVGGEQMTNFAFTAINYTNKDFDVYFRDIAINGWMADAVAACWLEAGEEETQICQLRFSNNNYTGYGLDYCGVTEITDARFTLAYGGRDYDLKDYAVKDINVYVNGITAETVSRNERRTRPNETVVVDNDDFAFVVLEYDKYDSSYVTSPSSFAGFYPNDPGNPADTILARDPNSFYFMKAYVENKTDYMVDFDWCGKMVNNLCITGNISNMILQPHSRGYITLCISTEELYRYGMLSVDKIVGDIRAVTVTSDYAHILGTLIEQDHTIYPTGLTESQLPKYDRITSDYEMTQIDDSHCLFVVSTSENFRKASYSFFIENRTDETLCIIQRSIVVNGTLCEPPEYITVAPHSCRFGSFPSMQTYAPQGKCAGTFEIIVTNNPRGEHPAPYQKTFECTFDY